MRILIIKILGFIILKIAQNFDLNENIINSTKNEKQILIKNQNYK